MQVIKKDTTLKRDLQSKRLISLGISLIGELGACPLCLTSWDPDKLRQFLIQRELKAQEGEKAESSIRKFADEIDIEVNKMQQSLKTLISACTKLKEKELSDPLSSWANNLETWSKRLKDAVEDYDAPELLSDQVKVFYGPQNWKDSLEAIEKRVTKIEKFTPEQHAWNTLMELKSALKRYLDDNAKYQKAAKFAQKAAALETIYTETKDKVLKDLFDSVNQDFSTYYKVLHGDDEKDFQSELKPDGPQLDFKVDFYGRGTHHPRALHSEGHQDSMGLCLYLALNKKISEGKVKVAILDDVVMSIDASHRRNICKLLNTHFPDTQFVITTHNRTWARQLKTDGVVQEKNMAHFKAWNIDTGPRYEEDKSVWENIKKKLDDNDVSSAAHELREHCEYFYENVCDSLRADVPYRSDNRWELGHYVTGAKEAYKKYLKTAKIAANSWDKKDDVQKLSEIESQANEIIKRTQMEHWGINENVHYTKWKDFVKEDFQPIAEAFQDLETLFRCPSCQGIIDLNLTGEIPSSMKCPCGDIFWNLQAKK